MYAVWILQGHLENCKRRLLFIWACIICVSHYRQKFQRRLLVYISDGIFNLENESRFLNLLPFGAMFRESLTNRFSDSSCPALYTRYTCVYTHIYSYHTLYSPLRWIKELRGSFKASCIMHSRFLRNTRTWTKWSVRSAKVWKVRVGMCVSCTRSRS